MEANYNFCIRRKIRRRIKKFSTDPGKQFPSSYVFFYIEYRSENEQLRRLHHNRRVKSGVLYHLYFLLYSFGEIPISFLKALEKW